MIELKKKLPELDRCLKAIYLELPETVARDLNRIVCEAIAKTDADAFTAGRADRQAEDARIARNFKGGWTASLDEENKLLPDPDGPWCLGSDVADAILAPSSGPTFEQRIRAEIDKSVRAACQVKWVDDVAYYKGDDVLAAIQQGGEK